jgi:hypothetical protein
MAKVQVENGYECELLGSGDKQFPPLINKILSNFEG